MALSETATRESAAVHISSLGSWVSLFTDAGGTTEASGGSPAYARKQTTWTSGASDGSVAGSMVEIDVPAGTYYYAGIHSASTGGTLVAKVQLNGGTGVVLNIQGKVQVTPTIAVA